MPRKKREGYLASQSQRWEGPRWGRADILKGCNYNVLMINNFEMRLINSMFRIKCKDFLIV